ncbi:hypothetical protein D1871_06770 [Nakamurella silvestris]|nr:hypothetical protein D1871_06770 [Nakamurella silvestris]
MTTPTAGEPAAATSDERAADPNSGPRRVLIALYAIFALAAISRAAVQISTKFDEAPLAYSLSLFSGLVYLAAATGLILRGPVARGIAWAACSIELLGVLVIGILSIFDSNAFPHDTVWSRFGSGYVFIPVILPVLGLWFLFHTRADRAPTEPAVGR